MFQKLSNAILISLALAFQALFFFGRIAVFVLAIYLVYHLATR